MIESALTKNHLLNDCNKRIGFIAALSFVLINGWLVVANQAEAAAVLLKVAASEIGQDGFAAWMRDRTQPRV